MRRYEFLEHTADVAARMYGRTLADLLVSAAYCMFAVLVAKKKNEGKAAVSEIRIKVSGESSEELLKNWLDELLYLFSTRRLVLHRAKSVSCSGGDVEARLLMDTFSAARYELKDEIKAVTYHELRVERINNRWRAHVIFDV